MDFPELLTLKEAARVLRVSPRWLSNRAEEYGGTRAFGRPVKFFKDLICARLEDERRECRTASQAPVPGRVDTVKSVYRPRGGGRGRKSGGAESLFLRFVDNYNPQAPPPRVKPTRLLKETK
jgi:hypothetical protein